MRNLDTGRGATVPLHTTVKRAAILRQTSLNPDEFSVFL